MAAEVRYDPYDHDQLSKAGVATHSYVEISMTQAGINIVQKPATDENIPTICEESTAVPGTAIWKLLASYHPYLSWATLPYSKQTLQALQTHWHLDNTSFMCPQVEGAMRYKTKRGEADVDVFRMDSEALNKFHLVISHARGTRETFAMFHGSQTVTIVTVITSVLAMARYAYQPQLLPFVLIADYIARVEFFILSGELARDWRNIKQRLGCEQYYNNHERYPVLDLTEIPRTLTSLSTVTADMGRVPKVLRQQVAFIGQLNDDFPASDSDDKDLSMRNRLHLMHLRCQVIESGITAMKESVESMVQMVYATLQQRDNDLNRRYAADMRVITAITLVFLPGTFVATLFSASFWNFDPRSSGPLVSKWVWLYFFITIALTLIVLGVWRGYTILKGGMKKVKHLWHSNQLLRRVTRRKKQDDEEAGEKALKDK